MANENLNGALERLSLLIDPMAHEQRRWANDEGVVLSRTVEWAKEFIADRAGFELVDPKAFDRETQALTLNHEGRQKREVATIFFRVAQGYLTTWAKPNEAGGFSTDYPGHQEATRLQAVDADSVGEALARIVLRLNFIG